jgi:hypothetical protein
MAESHIQELRDNPHEDVAFDGHGLNRYERAPERALVATLAILAIAAAVIAILVSVVLLVSRQSHNPSSVTVEPSTSTTTPTTTQVPTTPTTTQVPTTPASASPAPPPVGTVTDPSTNPAPVVVPIDPPAPPKSPPKLNVTRTSAAAAPVVKAPPFNGGDWPGHG